MCEEDIDCDCDCGNCGDCDCNCDDCEDCFKCGGCGDCCKCDDCCKWDDCVCHLGCCHQVSSTLCILQTCDCLCDTCYYVHCDSGRYYGRGKLPARFSNLTRSPQTATREQHPPPEEQQIMRDMPDNNLPYAIAPVTSQPASIPDVHHDDGPPPPSYEEAIMTQPKPKDDMGKSTAI